jgi:exopolyphosphatase / guanosine-5'-triphosphate,3'-diphosphate pyrophosphatase
MPQVAGVALSFGFISRAGAQLKAVPTPDLRRFREDSAVRTLAAVDIGSNTVHALVVEEEHGVLTDVAHHVEMPELGAAVQRTGKLGKQVRRRALQALERVVAKARETRFEHLVAGATQAVREAADGGELLAEASEQLGVAVRLISAEREAELSFRGVASRHAGRRDWLMADLGGGSTEVVAADGSRLLTWVSLPIGSGAAAARYLSDPPRPEERRALRQAALPVLRRAPESDAERLVVTGGTASNLPLVLATSSPPEVLTTQALLAAEERLDAAPAADLARRLGLEDARVRALRAGVEILLLLLDYYGLHSLHVSHEGLRHGMILAWLEKGEDWWRT